MEKEQAGNEVGALHSKHKIVFGLITALFVVLIFGTVTYTQLKTGDFQPHLRWAQQLGESSYLFLRANILFQRLVLVVRDILPFNFLARISPLMQQIIDLKSYDISGWIVTVIAYLATFFFSVKYINANLAFSKNKALIGSLATFLVMLAAPIFLFTYPDRQYLAYFNGNAFHNPTYLLMRPFAVIFFIFTINSIFVKTKWRTVFIASGVLFLATLAKPSFTLSFIPSIFVVIVFFYYKEIKQLNFRFIVVSVILTSVIVLVSQFIIMYTGSRGDRVLLSPFEAIMGHVPDMGAILISALLSILFPLMTTIFYWKKVRSKLSVQLVIVNFVLSLFIAYLFTEQVDMLSLNFWWTPMMALFLWFLVSLPLLINEVRDGFIIYHRLTFRSGLLCFLLFLHLVCGVIYYTSSLSSISPVQ